MSRTVCMTLHVGNGTCKQRIVSDYTRLFLVSFPIAHSSSVRPEILDHDKELPNKTNKQKKITN